MSTLFDIEEKQNAEASERERRAAVEEVRKRDQLIEDQKKSQKDHIRRVLTQAEEDSKVMRVNCEKMLKDRLQEQERLFKEGFGQMANAIKAEIDGLIKTMKEQDDQKAEIDGLKKALKEQEVYRPEKTIKELDDNREGGWATIWRGIRKLFTGD